MQYMFLIYDAQDSGAPKPGTPEFEEHIGAYFAFTAKTREDGVFVAGNPLQDVETATTVRVRDTKVATVDGPFAETKETLGGYYILDCKDLDEAIEYAAKIPTAVYGSIEIRPVASFA